MHTGSLRRAILLFKHHSTLKKSWSRLSSGKGTSWLHPGKARSPELLKKEGLTARGWQKLCRNPTKYCTSLVLQYGCRIWIIIGSTTADLAAAYILDNKAAHKQLRLGHTAHYIALLYLQEGTATHIAQATIRRLVEKNIFYFFFLSFV